MDSARALSSIIGGVNRVHRLHAYSVDLPAHTYRRNRNSVALSCACMAVIADRCPDLQVTVVDLNEQRFADWYRSFYGV